MLDRSIPPLISEFTDLSLPLVKTTVLSNKARIISYNGGKQPIIQVHFVWTGGKYDFDNPSIPKLLSLALREGTNSYCADDIEEILDFNGATLKVVARDHNFVLSLTCLSGRLGELLRLIKEMIECPTFPEDRLHKVKERLKSNLDILKKKPSYYAELGANRQIAGNSHPINIKESHDLIDAVELSVLEWASKQILQPRNLSVFVAGMLNERVIGDLTRFVDALKDDNVEFKPRGIVPFDSSESDRLVYSRVEASLQSAVYMSIPSIDRSHQDYCLLRMAVFALGGYFGSRLMTNIREDKGLTYGITSGLLGYPEGSAAVISCQCDNKYVGRVIDESKKEILNLVGNPPSGVELDCIRRTAYTQLAVALDSPFNVMDTYVTYHVLGISPNYFVRQKEAIRLLSPELISAMAEKYLRVDNLFVSVAGDNESMIK